jgi:hypothetical protein
MVAEDAAYTVGIIEPINTSTSSKLSILFFKAFPPFLLFVLWDISKYPVRGAYRLLGQSLRACKTSRSARWPKDFSSPQSRDKYRFA